MLKANISKPPATGWYNGEVYTFVKNVPSYVDIFPFVVFFKPILKFGNPTAVVAKTLNPSLEINPEPA